MTCMILVVILLCIVISDAFNVRINRYNKIIKTMMIDERSSLFIPTEDEDVDNVNAFKSIASNYLYNKFRDCRGDSCRDLCDKKEVEDLVRAILPPVSKDELQKEINLILKNMNIDKDGLIDTNQFLSNILDNRYWLAAGPLVVKELIFLDCLHNYYFQKQQLLEDNDYNELKEQLTWEGSSVPTMKSQEAHFVTAVASNAKGE